MGAERPTEKGGQHWERSEQAGKPDPLGKPRQDPRKGAGARQGQAPRKGGFPYLDTLVISRLFKIRKKPPNYES